MVQFRILDTGKANTTNSGGTYSNANRAGFDGSSTVNPFTINIISQVMNGGGNVQTLTEIKNDTSLSKSTPVTFGNPTFILSCSIPTSLIPSSGYQYDWLYQLILLERTKGLKLLYLYDSTGGGFTGDRNQTTLERYGKRYLNYESGAWNTEVGGSDVPFIPGYIKGIGNITYSSKDDMLNFTITFVVEE